MEVKTKIIRIITTVWLGLCVYIYLSYCLSESTLIDGELYTLYFMKISTLTFPLGIVAVTAGEIGFFGLAGMGLDLSVWVNQQIVVFIIWLVMVFAGYLQWFILVPKFYKWLRKHKNKHS